MIADTLTLDAAKTIIAATRAKARELDLLPLGVIVVDAGGHVLTFEREDGASNFRFGMAHGKAYGSVGLGSGSRAIFERAQAQPFFVQALNGLANGALVPSPGGVLIKAASGAVLGAVGVSGDTGDNDEVCAVAGVVAAGFTPQVA